MTAPPPTVSAATLEAYDRLPEVYRDADATIPGPSHYEDGTYGGDVYGNVAGGRLYPLLRYLSLLLDQLAPVDTLIDRLTYVPDDDPRDPVELGTLTRVPGPQFYGSGDYGTETYADSDTADLVDPTTAEAGWLPWLAQLLGVPTAGASTEELRAKLAAPEQAWAHGTADAIRATIAPGLTDTRYVDVLPHYTGDPFVLGVVTIREETPSLDTVGALEAALPRLSDLEAAGSLAGMQTPTVRVAGELERPAGYQLVHVYLDELP